jgi:4-amino-4-deoxy-L-arabinose transferase-like glycosyltransferase
MLPSMPDRSGATRTVLRTPRGEWLLMLLVAVGLRVAYVWLAAGPHARPFSDPAEYDAVAWNLARGAGFALESARGTYPTAFVPPVLPWLVSLLYRAVGHDYFAALLLVAVLGGLLPLLVAALGSRTFGSPAGRLAGWLATFHPLLVFFSGYLLTEIPFCLALLLALLLSAEWVKTPRPGRAFGAGLAWGVAALTRPTALPLPFLVAAWAWLPLGLSLAPRGRLRQVAVLLLGSVLVIAPWTLRNAVVLHEFVPVTTGAGQALLDSNNPVTWGSSAARGGADGTLRDQLLRTEFRGLSEAEVDRRARARALAFVRERAADGPAVALAKLGRFWRLRAEAGTTGAWQASGSPLARLLQVADPLLLWSVVVLPFALWGAGVALRGARRWFQSLGLWVILYFTAGATLFFGSLRMRVPIEPMVVLFAAAGLDDLLRRWRARQRGLRLVPRS